VIVEVEAWSDTPVRLEPELAALVATSPLAEVRLAEPPDGWSLVTGSSVGVTVGDGWELRVHPRIAIPRLLFLLAYAHDQRGWRDVTAGFGAETDLLSAVAVGFSLHASRAVERGPIRSYVSFDERRPDLRGRVRFGDQIARVPGLPMPLEVTFDDHTADVQENRMLRSASEILLRLPRVAPSARARMLRVDRVLEEVRVLRDPRDFTVPRITRLNARYEPALVLAKLVLDHMSVTARSGNVSSATFEFDMNRVFEDFVSSGLREALRRHGGEVRFQEHGQLAVGPGLPIKPDVTWWSRGRCVAVIDAKYKSIANATMPNSDAYQMLAYCIAHRRRRGFVVYAHDSGERVRRHTIRNSGHVIDVRTLDVAMPPSELLEAVATLAGEIARHARDRMPLRAVEAAQPL
jgi:5-methylcytosine-specific restriction enzyme subunit McrC